MMIMYFPLKKHPDSYSNFFENNLSEYYSLGTILDNLPAKKFPTAT